MIIFEIFIKKSQVFVDFARNRQLKLFLVLSCILNFQGNWRNYIKLHNFYVHFNFFE